MERFYRLVRFNEERIPTMSSGNSRLKKTIVPSKRVYLKITPKQYGDTIRCQPMGGGEPQMCRENVEKRIRAMGGSAVYGWKIVKQSYAPMLIKHHHVIWQSPEGELMCVTPVFTDIEGEMAIAEFPETIQFERDDNAVMGESAMPNKYVCLVNNEHLQKAGELMEIADQHIYTDLEQCKYWTQKANAEARKSGFDIQWTWPKALTTQAMVEMTLGK
jgi:hypothetical protein